MDIFIIILIVVAVVILLMKSNRVKSPFGFKSGIPELVSRMYNEYIRILPDCLELTKLSNYLITDAVYLNKTKDADMEQSAIRVMLKSKSYIFYFSELPGIDTMIGSWYKRGSLDIFLNGKRILFLKLAKDKRHKHSPWRAAYVEGFVEGDWIKDFQELERQLGTQDLSRFIKKEESDEPEKQAQE